MEAEARVILITAPSPEVALDLARRLVGERLLACANLVPGVTSVFRWEGEVQEEQEVLLVGKTRASLVARLESRLEALHPYDVPECIALVPGRVEARYLAWLLSETDD